VLAPHWKRRRKTAQVKDHWLRTGNPSEKKKGAGAIKDGKIYADPIQLRYKNGIQGGIPKLSTPSCDIPKEELPAEILIPTQPVPHR